MDSNKGDASKCIKIGKQALEAGDEVRALKFLKKALRLDPSLHIDELIAFAENSSQNPSNGSETKNKDDAVPDTSSSNPTNAWVSSSKDYTEEQLTIVKGIKKQTDYYKILSLERNCTVEDVRKAYRKLSLKVHPDKNKAPGSEEAFKAVSKAFQCLSNEEKKKRYDLVGSEEPSYGNRAATRQYSNGTNGFYNNEFDFDPDEIFRNFFGGRGPQTTTPFGTSHFRTGGHTNTNLGGGNFRMLIQIIPVIIIILMSFLPSMDPVYTLSRNYPYEHRLETSKGVAYFVQSSAKFVEDYPYNSSERENLERHVERDYVGVLSQRCHAELQRRHWGFVKEMPHCDMLEKFQAAA